MNDQLTYQQVKNYYGKVLKSSDDLKSDACCTDEGLPDYVKPVLSKVHEEVLTRYYGCGLVLPEQLAGCRVLDLGCGAGRDVYVISALVGEKGEVVGVDMTDEQLAVAGQYQAYHAETFGHQQPNTQFHQGYIERLGDLELKAGSFDVIVSNCVINLSPNKASVFQQCYELLKPGGELYFSDVYADRRIPQHLQKDEELYGECISGALYWNDFLHLAKASGFADPRLVTSRPLLLRNEAIEKKVGDIKLYSATYRLFKLPHLEPSNEDYGQSVVYRGGIEHCPERFTLDGNYDFELGQPTAVCGNTVKMLKGSRFEPFFDYSGNYDEHRGVFPGASLDLPFSQQTVESNSGGCC